MKNRQSTHVPLRESLTAALDTEYARASRRKDIERMAEVTVVSEALRQLWDGLPSGINMELVNLVEQKPPPSLPEPPPEPLPLPAAPGGMADLSIRDIVSRVEPMPVVGISDQGDRRRAARTQVQEAVAEINRLADGEHYRYELALMVINQNIEAMGDLKDAAAAAGLPVIEYAKRTIAAHNARRRRAGQVYAIEERALKEIDAAAGDQIEAIAERAVKDIRGET